MKLFPALALFLTAVFALLSTNVQANNTPRLIVPIAEYSVGYYGCVVKIQHGQYATHSFANINYIAGGSHCRKISARVLYNDGVRNRYGELTSFERPYLSTMPNGGTAAARGTHLSGFFFIDASKYGVRCELVIGAQSNGEWGLLFTSIDSYDGNNNCNGSPAWIQRIR